MCRTLSKYPVEARHAALTGKSVQNANFYAKATIFFIVGTYIHWFDWTHIVPVPNSPGHPIIV